MEELKNSINNVGLIEPLVVRPLDNNKYEVVCGMRRYYALKDFKIGEVECSVKKLTDIEAIDIAFLENLQREELTSIEEGILYLTRLKLEGDFLKIYEKSPDFLGSISNNSEFTKKLAQYYSVSSETIASRIHLITLPEEIQNAIENKELTLSIARAITRFNQIEDKDITQECMLEIFKDYQLEKDSISLNEINARITKKLDYYKSKEVEQKVITEARIKELKKKIKETEKAKDVLLIKLARAMLETFDNEGLEDIDFSEVKTEDEEGNEIMMNLIIEDEEDDDDLLNKNDKEDIVMKGAVLLEVLEIESDKYTDNKVYENIASEVDDIDERISDIQLLKTRVKEKNIRQCPFCYAGVDLPAIKRKENIYKEQLEEKKKQRGQIAGIKSVISDSIKQLNKLIDTVATKDKFIETFNKEMEELSDNA